MIYARSGASFEASFNLGTTGLVGTCGVTVYDGIGGTTTARSTSGIVEIGTTGIYVATVTASSTLGQYLVVMDDGSGTSTSEDLTVTVTGTPSSSSSTPAGTIPLSTYISAVQDIGVPDLSDSIITDCLNAAQTDICGNRLWSFRIKDEDITGGSATVGDLGVIDSAYYTDSSNNEIEIRAIDKRQLQRQGLDFSDSTSGPPLYFYLDLSNTVACYPLNDFTLRYYQNPTEVSASDDVFLIPDDMKMVLIYQAAAHAFTRVGILDLAANYFGLAKTTMDNFDPLYNKAYVEHLKARYDNPEG